MADHTEQLVGNLFHILSEEGYTEAQQALLSTYQSRAATDRAELIGSCVGIFGWVRSTGRY
ncbi:MAG: hypothetical protein ABEH80_04165, partial [Halobaculum sp.]